MNPLLKKIIRLIAGIAIIALGLFVMNGLIGMKEPPSVTLPENNPRPVKTIVVANSSISPRIPVEGMVEAWRRIDLFAEVNGVLSLGGKEFREGVKFSEGNVILKLDDSEARSQLKSARAQFLQLVTSTLATIKVDFPNRFEEWEEYVRSIDIDSTLPSLPNYQSDREKFYIINRGIEASFHSIKSSEERLSKFEITAPFDGFVSTALVKPGSLVMGGQPLGVFVGTDEFEIKSALNADYLGYISEGDKVEFFSNEDVVAEGVLDRLSSSVNPQTQSATAFFKLSSSKSDTELRDGMYLPGELIAGEIVGCFEIDLALVEKGKVYSVKNGELRHSSVKVVFSTYEKAIVTGLNDGEVILAEVLSESFVGMKVNPSSN